MAVAVNDAIGSGKQVPHPLFNVVSCSGAVTKTDTVSIQLDQFCRGQGLLGGESTHIAMHGVYCFASKDFQDGEVCEVTCMEDNGTVNKDLLYLRSKVRERSVDMGIRKDADTDHLQKPPDL